MKKEWISWVRCACLLFAVTCLYAGCSTTPRTCGDCKVGEKKCSPDQKSVMTCKKAQSTGCWAWTSQACITGQVCQEQGDFPSCVQEQTNQCQGACTAGTKQCQGLDILECKLDPGTGCPAWSKSATCTAPEACDQNTQQCAPIQGCTPKAPETARKCVGNDVHWFDDCDQQGAKIETCAAPTTCQNGQCAKAGCTPTNKEATRKCVGQAVHWFDDCDVQGEKIETCVDPFTCDSGQCKQKPQGCTPQNPEAIRKCVGNDVHWYDDCDQQGKLIESCNPPKTCDSGQCKGPACQPQQERRCVGQAVHWFDSCGAQGALIETCQSPQTCQSGQCSGSAGCQGTHQCSLGSFQCQGNGVQTCQTNAQSQCREWSAPTPCSSNQTCQNGQCQGTSGGQCSSHRLPKTNPTCSDSSDCCTGQSCITVTEILGIPLLKACGPCVGDSDCPKTKDGVPTRCCTSNGKKACLLVCF